MKKTDLRSLQRLAEKNREASKAAQDAQDGRDPGAKRGKHDLTDGRSKPDPRYEGADRLFKEMKKKDRP